MNDFDDFIKEFLVECRERLNQLDNDLVALEEAPTDTDRLESAFRTLHTIKGNAGFLGFTNLGELAHRGESLLGQLRDGERLLNRETIDVLLQVVDKIREMLFVIESTGNESEGATGELSEKLDSLTGEESSGVVVAPSDLTARVHETIRFDPSTDGSEKTRDQTDDGPPQTDSSDPAHQPTYQFNIGSSDASPETRGDLSIEISDDVRVSDSSIVTPSGTTRSSSTPAPSGASTALRVEVGLLDYLMNLVGELVLARNQILQTARVRDDPALADSTQRLNQLTSELQEGVMRTRMQQIDTLWRKYPRMVRDLARQCNKEVRLVIQGGDTELDRTLLETLTDPLLHLVRNAIDHGIEDPGKRRLGNKPDVGCLSLNAFHQGGHVHIEISDDGAGLDLDKIKRRATERGLINRAQAASMRDADACQLIFYPGFSTADEISNLSGRGVGMDVVRNSISQIRGNIDIESQRHIGTTIRITVPLTLAIVPALIINGGAHRFAIPQINVAELITLEGAAANDFVEHFHSAPVFRLRDNLLPLVWLNEVLRIDETSRNNEPDETNIVVLQAGMRRFAMVVPAISNTEEIVVKPIGHVVAGLSVYAGATIMGDGRVALILDVLGTARQAGLFARPQDQAWISPTSQEVDKIERNLLLCGVGRHRIALPIAEVSALEKVPREDVELSGNQEVAQCRGGLMSLIRMRTLLGEEAASDEEQLSIVVYTESRGSIGLVVDEILDVVEQPASVQVAGQPRTTSRVSVIDGKVTDLVSIQHLIRDANPVFFHPTDGHATDMVAGSEH